MCSCMASPAAGLSASLTLLAAESSMKDMHRKKDGVLILLAKVRSFLIPVVGLQPLVMLSHVSSLPALSDRQLNRRLKTTYSYHQYDFSP